MDTFNEVISVWPRDIDLADDAGVTRQAISMWRTRDRIPAARWNRLLRAANARKIPGLSLQLFADMAERGLK